MNRPVRIGLTVLAVVAGLCAVAAIAVPFLFDADALRPRAEAELSRLLGRKVALGRARVSLLSGLALRAESLRIGEPLAGEAKGAPILAAGPTAVRVAILPLLRRDVQARSIRIEGATITQDGRPLLSALDVDSALRLAADGTLQAGGRVEGRLDLLAGAPPLSATFAAKLKDGTLSLPRVSAQIGVMALEAKGRVEGIATPAPHAILEIAARLPKSEIAGPVDVTVDAEAPRVGFDLVAERLDVDELLAVAATGSLAARSGFSLVPEARALDAPAETPWLARVQGKGKIFARRVLVSGMELSDGRADVTLDRGQLVLDDTSIAAFGGTAKGRVAIRPLEPERPFTLRQKAEGVSLGALVASLAPEQKGTVDGTASLEFGATGRAGAPKLLPTLDGTGYLAVEDGKLASIGVIPQVMKLLESAGAKGVAKQETPFERLSAHFALVSGTARTSDLEFRSPDLDFDGGGTVGAGGALALDVLASFSKAVSGQLVAKTPALSLRVGEDGRISVPLELRGTLSAPKLRLDVDKILREGLQKKLKKDGTKKLLDKLFGR